MSSDHWFIVFIINLSFLLRCVQYKNENSIAIRYRATNVYFNNRSVKYLEYIASHTLESSSFTMLPSFQTSLFKNKTTRQYKEYNFLPIPDYMSKVNVLNDLFLFSPYNINFVTPFTTSITDFGWIGLISL